jgi:pyrroloquinoline quinone biosynthesis protein D
MTEGTLCAVRREGVTAEPLSAGLRLIGRDGSSHVLNVTAAALWELCDGATSVDEIVQAVCELTATPARTVAADVEQLIGELRDRELVDLLPAPSPPGLRS